MNAEQYRALVSKLERIQQIEEAEAPTATPGTPPPPASAASPAPANSQQNYNMALQQIKSLYAKAQVAYPPQDDIIRQRFGLPPALPPFEQWDGKMPEAGEADFLTRNVLGRQASKDIAQQNSANKLSSAGAGRADATVAAKVKELNDLVAKLGGGAPAAAPAAQSGQAAPLTPQNDPAMKDFMGESISLKIQMAKMLKENFNFALPEADEPAAPNAELIKQIQAVMAEINANMDEANPNPEASTALAAAQAALDKAQTAPAPAATTAADQADTDMGAAMTANAAQQAAIASGAQDDATGVDAAVAANAAAPATAQAGQAAPANQTFGQAFAAARKSGAKEFEYKGKKYSTAQKGENPALDAAMAGKKPATPTTPTAPAKPAAPMQKELPPGFVKPAPAQSGQAAPAPGSFAADMAARKKAANPLSVPTKESVGYQEDQTLARIISLANIGR